MLWVQLDEEASLAWSLGASPGSKLMPARLLSCL